MSSCEKHQHADAGKRIGTFAVECRGSARLTMSCPNYRLSISFYTAV